VTDVTSVDNPVEALIYPSLERFQGALDSYCAVYEKLEGWREPKLARSLLHKGARVRNGKGSWTKSDLRRIVCWKHLQPLIGRFEDSDTESRLADAFQAKDDVTKIETLCSISGVGPAVASILLALTYPEEHAALDAHAWNSLCRLGFDLPSKPISGGGYTIPELLRYLTIVRNLAGHMRAPWDVAKALHALDKVAINKKWKRELTSLRSSPSVLAPASSDPGV
jgi:hypothetical protein